MLQAYIGTYTKQDSKGIYLINISDEGKVTQIISAAQIENPTYLTLSNDQKALYSVAKVADQGGVASFCIQNDGTLSPLTVLTDTMAPPCFIAINQANNQLLSANYHTATIDNYHIRPDYHLDQLSSRIQHQGSGPHSRQEKAHAHYANFTPDNRWVLTCDLGTDEVTTYYLDQQQLITQQVFKALPGSGPRHLTMNQQQNYVYIMTELTSQIIACRFDNQTGKLSEPHYYATLPSDFTGDNKGSAIRLSVDEQYLYVSNRGQDAIVIFKVDGLKLTKIDTVSTYGQGPRDFNISHDGKIAIATNENSHTITVYQVNTTTGQLMVADTNVNIPEPVSIIFKPHFKIPK